MLFRFFFFFFPPLHSPTALGSGEAENRAHMGSYLGSAIGNLDNNVKIGLALAAVYLWWILT